MRFVEHRSPACSLGRGSRQAAIPPILWLRVGRAWWAGAELNCRHRDFQARVTTRNRIPEVVRLGWKPSLAFLRRRVVTETEKASDPRPSRNLPVV